MNSSNSRHRTLGGGIQHVLDYLKRMQAEDSTFFYAIQGDNELTNGNIFWADANSRMNYNYFGDTIGLDTSYRTHHYRLPFASFTGLNHHGQPVLFGCALLLNESDTSFVWLLQTWLRAMSGNSPISITTDPDQLIETAVAQVLPETRHRFSKWSIFGEAVDKLANVYQSHRTLEIEFKKCVNEAETVDEFESHWQLLMERYYLMDNEWLKSMYIIRHKWVPAYMRSTFFGELSTDEVSEASSFFYGYVNASTNMQLLTKQYEKAITTWHEKELKADFDTTNTTPVLKTPSPMEKQAANLYTTRIFIKFQGELVETLANPATKIEDSGTIIGYRVAKFGEEHKAHTVRFNAFEMNANCSCHMFEFSGVICRHVLSVFRAKNVLTLPAQYVLKRWTRNAKSGGAMDERTTEFPSSTRESLTLRYNNLRQEAIKFVEEGAKSIHIYNVAMDALHEAGKKVAAVKKQNTTTMLSVQTNGDSLEMCAGGKNQATPCQSVDEKEKKIHEMTTLLESINQRCEVYRANLLAVLKDMEDQKLKLSIKVENARLSLKE